MAITTARIRRGSEVSGHRALDEVPVVGEAGAGQGAVPGALGVIPRNDPAEMGAGAGHPAHLPVDEEVVLTRDRRRPQGPGGMGLEDDGGEPSLGENDGGAQAGESRTDDEHPMDHEKGISPG